MCVKKKTFENPNEYPKSILAYLEREDCITNTTHLKYTKEFYVMLKGALKVNDNNLKRSLEALYIEYESKAITGQIAHSTFKTYRAFIIYGYSRIYNKLVNGEISDQDIDDGLDELFISDLYLKMLSVEYFYNENKPKRTSELKAKYFEKTFYNYLIRESELKKASSSRIGEYDLLLYAFVDANLILGLRPVEWFNTSFCCAVKGPKLIMRVLNGKSTHGRANGKIRSLILDGLTEVDKAKVFNFWNMLNKFSNKFASQNGISSCGWVEHQTIIRVLGERLSIKYKDFCSLRNIVLSSEDLRPTLYSTRHQCIANAKSNDVDKFDIAGVFGHAGSDTAKKHYGRKWRGFGSFKVQPTLDSVLNVNGGLEYIKGLLANNIKLNYNFELNNIVKDLNTIYHKPELKAELVIG